MAIQEIGFIGEVHETECSCHKEQFSVVVFCIHPLRGRHPLDVEYFATEAEASAKMQDVVLKVADRFLGTLGLKRNEAVSMTVAQDKEAVAHENRIYAEATYEPTLREEHPGLH